ncbi:MULTISPECIES: hypothetical protein [Staphylococcus]|uniref:Uncharacterized protein n=1 Tax=Staphylococcus equorum TaxID=246432 RepID=A0AAP7LUU7_9STAP|nr:MULTISPECIES: hypothetical protein [Staphylococcus]MDK9861645.1 hypothetical protein [Staphylococcus equorum]OEK58727.1 hypothetical protein ASS94_01830 [Staphylococcus equorum]RYD13630.1 hypothetical protein CGA19_01830 [Staphylococcus equorum]
MAKKYEVIAKFRDGEDKNKLYEVGDNYPKPANKKVSKSRIESLSSKDNKIGKPFIKEVEEVKEEE